MSVLPYCPAANGRVGAKARGALIDRIMDFPFGGCSRFNHASEAHANSRREVAS
jgi:hypothetical protein